LEEQLPCESSATVCGKPKRQGLSDYTYGHAGNRTALTSTVNGLTSYNYDDADRITSAGSTQLHLRPNGRETSKTTGSPAPRTPLTPWID
jgi:hypothetical protein